MDKLPSTIKQARRLLDAKEISAEELRSGFMSRIKEQNPKLNAYLDVYDAPVRPSPLTPHPSPLADIPGILKDNILLKGQKATGGSKILENYIASYDATVTSRLFEAGAEILGKGNLDEFACGSTGEYSAFGPTLNPVDPARVAGGSSSGPAAAVGAGLALFGLGSDTGGSIRMPASWCGIVGLKTTYGRVSRHGLMALASSLDQIGPFTRTVEDTAEVLKIIAGHDPMDATTSPKPVPDYVAGLNQSIKGLRVGVPKEYFGEGLDEQVRASVQAALKRYEQMGAVIDEVSLPLTDYALATYYIIVPSELSSNLARYDGIRYGLSKSSKDGGLLDTYLDSRTEGFGSEIRRRVMIGTYALSAGYFDAYYLKAQKVRTLIRQQFAKIFESHDVIIGPAVPMMAPRLGELDNPLAVYLADVYTVQANLAGLPALVLPCGYGSIDGTRLPIGIQIIGNYFDEAKILNVGHVLERDLSLEPELHA